MQIDKVTIPRTELLDIFQQYDDISDGDAIEYFLTHITPIRINFDDFRIVARNNEYLEVIFLRSSQVKAE